MTDTLKPCPFCGCDGMESARSTKQTKKAECCNSECPLFTIAMQVEQWNRRSLDAALLAQPAAADFTCDKTIYGHPRCAIQCPECAEPAAAGVSEWKVFCAICKKEWSVPYHHPGKSICNECERHSLTERADRVSVPREIDRSKHGNVLRVWNDCMSDHESLEMTWPKLVDALLAALPKE